MDILEETELRMLKAVENMENRFNNVRAGRANPSMVSGIMVDYYGAPTPIQSLANITVPEARQLFIKPFDRSFKIVLYLVIVFELLKALVIMAFRICC